MSTINYYSIQSKLNLHKLQGEVNAETNTVTIGHSKPAPGKIMIGLGLIVSAVIFFIVTSFGLGATSPLIASVLLLAGVAQIGAVLAKSNGNSNTRIISSNGVEIKGATNANIPTSEISTFEIVTDFYNEEARGILNVVTNTGNKYQLLFIIDKDMKHVKDDLDFLVNQFTMITKPKISNT